MLIYNILSLLYNTARPLDTGHPRGRRNSVRVNERFSVYRDDGIIIILYLAREMMDSRAARDVFLIGAGVCRSPRTFRDRTNAEKE